MLRTMAEPLGEVCSLTRRHFERLKTSRLVNVFFLAKGWILGNATHTNVTVMSAPHRHDLMRNSCVNNEVEVFNSKLHKRLQKFEKVEVIDVVSERNFYTKHGQHLNSEGKESMAKRIATTIECLLNRKVEPISRKWYSEEETDNQEHKAVQGKIDNPEDEKSECRQKE
jgi:hypothetical protein